MRSILVLVCGMLLTLATACSTVSKSTCAPPPATSCNGGFAAAATPTLPALPSLNPTQEADVTGTIKADPTIAALLGDRTYSVTRIGVWNIGSQVVGAEALLKLDHPKSFPQTDWPIVDSDQVAHSYKEGTMRYAAFDVTTLLVLVDFT